MEIFPSQKIKVINIKTKGRGVVAAQNIKVGEIIEICPIIFISQKEAEFMGKESDVLKFYYLNQFAIKKFCIMLGYGSLYNHSLDPNADIDYNEDLVKDFLYIGAIKDIKIGEEIVYNYEFDNNVVDFLDLD